MFEVMLIEDNNIHVTVYDTVTQGEGVFFLVFDDDRSWHYVNSDHYVPVMFQ